MKASLALASRDLPKHLFAVSDVLFLILCRREEADGILRNATDDFIKL
jgi:hypothetical protein